MTASIHFGKKPAKKDYRTLRFADYVTPQLPAPPSAYDALPRVYEGTRIHDPTVLFPMDGNDVYGDCTIAGVAHAITVYRGLIDQLAIMPETDVVKLYFSLTGGQDTGLYMLDVLNYWRRNTIYRDQVLAYVSVDPQNHTHVKQAIQIFGGVYLGFQVTRGTVREFNQGKPWKPGKLIPAGHAVQVTGYDADTLTVLTWGATQKGTWPWLDQGADEAYVILPPEAATPGFAPGFDFAQLQADLAEVAN